MPVERSKTSAPFLFALVLFVLPGAALGQGVTNASLRGTVTDQNDEPLPGANVLAIHQPSGTRYGATTNSEGRYNLANLRVGGPYTLEFSFVGYQTLRETGVSLNLGQTRRLDATLAEEAQELEAVEVVAERGGLLTGQSGISTDISSADIANTPTQGRQLADVVRRVPQAYVANSDDDGPAVSFAGQNTDFNSIFIDGAVSNDVFGLSAQGTDGGQSGATPISLSAIEQFNIDISPFDVTQSGFTGAAINAVTKSGSNEFEGTFEYFRRGDGLSEQSAAFSNNRYVASLGGPIIEDKLFFFGNVDILRSEEPQPFGGAYAGQLGVAGDDGDTELDGLGEIRSFVQRNTGYDAGGYGTRNATLDSDKALARLDYNLSENQQLTARYYYTGANNVDQFQSTNTSINFGNTAEVFPNDTHNAMLQWNGSFGNTVSNKLIVSYKSVTDDRGVSGEPFPSISVEDGNAASFSLGSEAFSGTNLLEQDVYTLTNTTNVFLGDHTLTLGTHNEYYELLNKFALFSAGSYSFTSVSDFAETICAFAEENPDRTAQGGPDAICQASYPNPEPQTDSYSRQYSLVDDDPTTEAFESEFGDDTNLGPRFSSIQLGFYAQDEWQVTDRLGLTYGLRVDIPKLLDDPAAAPDANSFTLSDQATGAVYDLQGARAGETPGWQIFWQPRVGFSYDFTEDRNTQLRGGTGVFTSRLPFVWPGSMYTNNGVSTDFLAGSNDDFLADLGSPPPLRLPENGLTRADEGVRFFGRAGVSPNELVPTGNLHVFSEDFSYPRVWRTSLGLDQDLPGGFVGTLEAQYTSKLQDIIVKNVNLQRANETLDGPVDNRPIHAYDVGEEVLSAGTAGAIDTRYGDILVAQNSTKGYSYDLTGRLQKEPVRAWAGGIVGATLSYTYGDAYAVQSYGGDTIGSLWSSNEHVNGTNNLALGRSEFSLGHRLQVAANLRQELSDNFALTVSAYYTGISGRPFSYTIGNSAEDMLGTGGGAALFYIPQSAAQLELAPIVDDGTVVRTAEQQRNDLDRFIESSEYLDAHQGEYAQRNADRTPFEGVTDLKFSLEIFGDVLRREQSVSVNFSIFNFSALAGSVADGLGLGIGDHWGNRYLGQGSFDVVRFQRFQDPQGQDDTPDNDFVPVYQSALGTGDDVFTDEQDIFEERTSGSTYSSRYQIQLGVQYTF